MIRNEVRVISQHGEGPVTGPTQCNEQITTDPGELATWKILSINDARIR